MAKSRIQMGDLPVMEELSREEMKSIFGGQAPPEQACRGLTTAQGASEGCPGQAADTLAGLLDGLACD